MMGGNRGRLADALVALNAATLGRPAICRLAQELERWLDAPPRQLPALAGELGVPARQLVSAHAQLRQANRLADGERAAAAAAGATVTTWLDPEFPAELRHLQLPPPVLYCRGAIPAAPAVAIVGSRRPDTYGREAARFFAQELARHGVTVVSGFARGVDGAAHRGALAMPQGRTVAVLGCGVDVLYPAEHRSLRPQVAAHGALVSEFPLGTQPLKAHFPIRNRIIAALGAATLVVQATPRSGSLITARLALELGREVLALPGRIFDELALGPNALLRDGARPALHPHDLLPEGLVAPADEGEELPPPLPGLSARLWRQLPTGKARGVDELAAAVDAAAPAVLAALLELELGGWVERFPGPVYCRRRP
ncbi:MAG TPA: DNA-processing protein DprA [Thermoanaerobaculia bacterium]|nr:DNA-processing protein DprA [Thermoanaerobaculia bacterium]